MVDTHRATKINDFSIFDKDREQTVIRLIVGLQACKPVARLRLFGSLQLRYLRFLRDRGRDPGADDLAIIGRWHGRGRRELRAGQRGGTSGSHAGQQNGEKKIFCASISPVTHIDVFASSPLSKPTASFSRHFVVRGALFFFAISLSHVQGSGRRSGQRPLNVSTARASGPPLYELASRHLNSSEKAPGSRRRNENGKLERIGCCLRRRSDSIVNMIWRACRHSVCS